MRQLLLLDLPVETTSKGVNEAADNLLSLINASTTTTAGGAFIQQNPLTRWMILRTLQDAAKTAADKLSDEAIGYALSCDPITKQPLFPGAAEGKDFMVGDTVCRVTIKNEYAYGVQSDADGRLDPNSKRWNELTAERTTLSERSKALTKSIAGIEALIRDEHPRMKPTEATVTLSLRKK